jgi:ABC-type sugar transport system ATPase subunit
LKFLASVYPAYRQARAGKERDLRVREASEIPGIHELLERKPKQLSGGQRQRVAVGRAIVRKPAVFLFDEPLSNLDAKLRVQMRAELSKLHDRLQTTIIYVTHDQVEAMTMGTKIVVMVEVIEPLGSEIHLNVTAGKHNLIAAVDVQTQVRVHQEIELALNLDKMHLFQKDPPNLRIKTES